MTPQTLRIGGGVEYLPGTSERKLAVDATLSSGTNNLNKIMGGWMIRGQLKPNRTSHLEDARNVNRTGCMADKLTPKERMRRTLERRPVDRLPVQTNYTAAMGAKLAACFQCAPSELPARLDNHLLRLDVTHTPRVSRDGRVRFDWWGAGWGTETEGYWHAHAPLAESTDLAAYSWPDPHAPGLLADAENTVAADGGQHFAVPNFGFALFERAWSLRGFDLLLMDMVDRPAWVEELLDRITEIQISLARRFLALGRHEHGEAPPSKSETRDPKSETDPSLLTSAASEARLRPNPVCVFPPFSPGRLDRTRRGPRSLELVPKVGVLSARVL